MNLDLPDGTKASLAPHSILIVPSKFEGLTERRVEMTKGKATFDVFENVDQPFVVDNGQTAIKVLGTIFVVDNTGEETVLENIEGKVKFYEKGEEDKGIVLLQGDKFKYNENSGFENLVVKEEPKPTPVPVKVPNLGPSHNLGYLMNKLMEASDHKIIPAADLDYDPSERVHIKIDKNLDKFISDLKAKALFELLPRDCEGCFEITRFAKK